MGNLKFAVIIAAITVISFIITMVAYVLFENFLHYTIEPLQKFYLPFLESSEFLSSLVKSSETSIFLTIVVFIISLFIVSKILLVFRYVSICSSCTYSTYLQPDNCPKCGSAMLSRCPICYKPFDHYVKYCAHCGTKTKKEKEDE